MIVSILSVRLAIVNFSPAIKRFFWWQPDVYALLSYAAFLPVISSTFSFRKVVIAVILLGWVAVTLTPAKTLLYLPILLMWVFSRYLSYTEVESAFWKLRYIFIASIAYALYQKQFGYLPHELNWIMSGISVVKEQGYFVSEDLRPFAFYAGVPEFGFVSGIFAYIAMRRSSITYSLLGLMGVFIAGSRGIILSMCIALLMLWMEKKRPLYSKANIVWLAFALAIVAYLILSVWLPSTSYGNMEQDAESRLMTYGTFNARVITLLNFYGQLNISNIWFGVGLNELFDNFYLTLLNDFGVGGLIAYLLYMINLAKTRCGMFFCVVILSYNLYADAMFSLYFSYNAFLFLNAKE